MSNNEATIFPCSPPSCEPEIPNEDTLLSVLGSSVQPVWRPAMASSTTSSPVRTLNYQSILDILNEAVEIVKSDSHTPLTSNEIDYLFHSHEDLPSHGQKQ